MDVLFVLTSHEQLGDTGKKTGFWLEEFAAPYYYLVDKGAKITIASPKGGQPPIDPKSNAPDAQTDATKRFLDDPAAQKALKNSVKLSEVNANDYDAIFYPGGHGPLWDLYNDKNSIALIQAFLSAKKPVAAVCHAPAALLNVKTQNGDSVVNGKKVTGFSNDEENAVGLANVVPYLLQDELEQLGGKYHKAANWQPHVEVDGLLITGQNPASSKPVAEALWNMLQ